MSLKNKASEKLGMHAGAKARIFRNAKSLRLGMTKAEELLWERLRKKQLKGYRFRRQHPVARYIVDFYCHALQLVIEVDGGYHDEPEQQASDLARTKHLESLGLQVIRFSNQEIFEDVEGVIERIMLVVEKRIDLGEAENKSTRSPSIP